MRKFRFLTFTLVALAISVNSSTSSDSWLLDGNWYNHATNNIYRKGNDFIPITNANEFGVSVELIGTISSEYITQALSKPGMLVTIADKARRVGGDIITGVRIGTTNVTVYKDSPHTREKYSYNTVQGKIVRIKDKKLRQEFLESVREKNMEKIALILKIPPGSAMELW